MGINEIIGAPPQNIGDVRTLLEAIRTADLSSARTLAKTLVHLDVPGMLPMMEGLLTDSNPDLSLAAYDWFARTSDERASIILTAKLEDINASESERWLAAEAVGRRGDAGAVLSTRRVAEEFVKPTRDSRELRDRLLQANLSDGVARLLVRLAIAEAELGGNELAAIPIIFALIEANIGREPIVRVDAVNALASVVGEGSLDVLRIALMAEDNEIAEGAIRALQLIGATEAVDVLVDTATPERMEIAEIALTAVVAVTGPGPGMGKSVFDLAPNGLRLWWQAIRPNFRSEVCYRCGKPISIATLVELLRDPKQRPYVADELRIVTGFDCGFDVDIPADRQDLVVSTAERWLTTAGANYKTGALFKYGYERDLGEALKTGVVVDS